MTAYSTESENHQPSSTSSTDPPLGWEGHVHFPEESPLWSNLLGNWPELRSGIAFSIVFVVGGLLGGGLAALLMSNRQKSHINNT